MRTTRLFLTGILCFILPSILFSQDFSNQGKEFWISYSNHVGMYQNGFPVMTLYITSDVNTNYKIEIYGGATIQSGSIIAGQVVTAVVPNTYFINDDGLYLGKAIRVTTDKNSVVYAYITRNAVSGATICLPTQVLGKEYYSMNFTQVSNEPNSYSYFTIIAVEDNTTVEITPSANTKGGWLAGTTRTVSLNKGEIYQVLGTFTYFVNSGSGSDLTGSLIKSVSTGSGSCKRIAVFSGSGKVSIGCAVAGTSDNLYQQLYPTGSWGLKYLTVPSYQRPYNYYRIIRKSTTTNVRLNDVLIPGASFINGVYEFINNIPNKIEASEPVSVAQYFTTQNCSGNPNFAYDPDMIILNPVEQNINKVTLVSSNLAAPTNQQHHLHIIIPNGGTSTSSFKLDGVAVSPSSWIVHPSDAGYSYLYLANVSQGYHTLSSDSGFNALAYGYADFESYGYSAGANVKDLYQFVSIKNQYATVNFPATCKSAPFYFKMVFPYQPTQIQWVFGSALNSLGLSDVTIANPSLFLDSTWSLNGKQLYRYGLPGSYSINTIGTYPIKVIANNPTSDGCSGIQEIDYDLQVFNPPTSSFSFSSNGCVTGPVNFLESTNAGVRPIIKTNWDFGDAITTTGSNPSHTYAASGSYNTSLSVITDVGCISDTAKQTINLTQAPVANFGINAPACTGRPVTLNDMSATTGGATLAKWYWDFGDGTPAVIATANTSQVHIYSASGTFNATLKVETSTGCQSIVFAKPITSNVFPVASFNLPDVCLPAGNASFVNNSTITDGTQAQLTYNWNFGNGQTSAVANGATVYSSTGPFTVTLTATSNNGCVDDTVRVLNTIYSQPQASFNAPAEVCLGNAASFADQSTAPNSTINQWLWNFGDGTNLPTQNPGKNYLAPGSYTVTLVTKSAIGCPSTTATKTIVVNALPTADFTTSNPACESRNITFTDASAANAGNLVKWTWNYGDASNAILATSSPFTHNYATAGTYNINLQVETNKGCVSPVLSKQVIVNPLPKAGFISPEICLADPFAPFTDTSKIASGSVASWIWNFGDPNASAANPNTSTLQNPKHRYTVIGSYTTKLIVTSNQGCVDTIAQAFTVNGSVPAASFNVQKINTLCSNKDVNIADASTVDFGSIVKTIIYWDFANDPSVQTVDDNPSPGKMYTHTYAEFGSPATKTYTVRMTSYSGVSCLNTIDKTITVLATPSIRFDAISEVCTNTSTFQITQAGITNTLPGTGVFNGPGVSTAGFFNPASTGVSLDTLRYTYTGTNGCTNYKDQTIRVNPTPIANAGPDKLVLEGGMVQITPALTANFPVTYSWTPPLGLSSATIADPVASPPDDITYTLTVTSDKGCSTSDQVFIKVLKAVQVPNVFSPNGDGIHDKWIIGSLDTYPGCTVEVFNRYGQRIFYSVGYSVPWDGTVNGKPVPVGTYYYIVDPKNGRRKQAGYVDVIR